MQTQKTHHSIITIALVLAILAASLPAIPAYAAGNVTSTNQQTWDANIITFSVRDLNGQMTEFKNLNIEGINQYNNVASWKTRSPGVAKLFEYTDKYYWRDTIILTFEIKGSKHTCIVENLRLEGGETGIVYDMTSSICSGSGGGVAPLQSAKEYKKLREFVKSTDAYKIISILTQLRKGDKVTAACLAVIGDSFKIGYFNVNLCEGLRGQVVENLADILTDYGLEVIYGK